VRLSSVVRSAATAVASVSVAAGCVGLAAVAVVAVEAGCPCRRL
jgi:hypothetical protein